MRPETIRPEPVRPSVEPLGTTRMVHVVGPGALAGEGDDKEEEEVRSRSSNDAKSDAAVEDDNE